MAMGEKLSETVNFRIPPSVAQALDEKLRPGQTRNDLVRKIVENWLSAGDIQRAAETLQQTLVEIQAVVAKVEPTVEMALKSGLVEAFEQFHEKDLAAEKKFAAMTSAIGGTVDTLAAAVRANTTTLSEVALKQTQISVAVQRIDKNADATAKTLGAMVGGA